MNSAEQNSRFSAENHPHIPADLTVLPQWVCWHYIERDGKTTKLPIDAKSNGRLLNAKSNDQATWSDFETAVASATRLNLPGVGLCLSETDGLTGLDLDHVIDPATGEMDPLAMEVLTRFAGTYTEVSPSGNGLRIWCYGKPQRSGKCIGKVKWLEVYSHPSNRYLTVTGNHWSGSATEVTDQQSALDWLHSRFMESTEKREPAQSKPRSSPVDSAFDLDDAALLDKAHKARNGTVFGALWSGDTSGHGGDESGADLALLNLLAFWTDRDPGRMDRLFRQSGLMRAKWDERRGEQTYGQISIAKAIAGCREGYSGNPVSESDRRRAETLIAGMSARSGQAEPGDGREPGSDDREPGSDDEAGPGTDGKAAKFRFCDTSTLRTATLTPPQFIINPLIPRGHLTLFGGHGGSGKTTVSLVLAAHVAAGQDWSGLPITQGRVLIVSFEDGEALLLWRLKNIVEQYGLDFDALIPQLDVIDATDADAVMIEALTGGIRSVEPSADGEALMTVIRERQYDLVMIDNASDAFDGDENHRRQVRRFVRYCADSVKPHNGAIVLLAHIDKSAARYGASGNSYSGSTGWHNSARSRLALVENELRQEKLNVGKVLPDPILLDWTERGVPILANSDMAQSVRNLVENADDAAMLTCFRAAIEAGAMVSASNDGPSTTWHALSIYPECPKFFKDNKARFRESIARLIRAGKIRREEYLNAGRKRKERLIMVIPD